MADGGKAVKLSVSVPEDLLEAAVQRAPQLKDSPSALVQAALRSFLTRTTRPRPFVDPEQRKVIVEKLAAEAKRAYESGYACGTSLTEKMDFEALETFTTGAVYDFQRWRKILALETEETLTLNSGGPVIPGVTPKASDGFWLTLDEQQSTTWIRGCADALKDFYDSAVAYFAENAMQDAYDDWKQGG